MKEMAKSNFYVIKDIQVDAHGLGMLCVALLQIEEFGELGNEILYAVSPDESSSSFRSYDYFHLNPKTKTLTPMKPSRDGILEAGKSRLRRSADNRKATKGTYYLL